MEEHYVVVNLDSPRKGKNFKDSPEVLSEIQAFLLGKNLTRYVILTPSLFIHRTDEVMSLSDFGPYPEFKVGSIWIIDGRAMEIRKNDVGFYFSSENPKNTFYPFVHLRRKDANNPYFITKAEVVELLKSKSYRID